ncbi:MAG: ATP-binding protein [Ferruginibacter sp.]
MFDQIQGIPLSTLDGWRFQEGNNPDWANTGINTTGWKKMKPEQVSKKMASKDGRVEGWFRLKIRLDSSFQNLPLYLGINERGASDTYVDGKLFESYGNTGINGNPFKTPVRSDKPHLTPIHLAPGKELIVAIHVVNYVPRFPLNLLESELGTYPVYPFLSGPEFVSAMNTYYEELGIYETVATTVCFVLILLFWLLAFQNPRETNLRLIALCTTFFGISAWLGYLQVYRKFSLAGTIAHSALLHLFQALMGLMMLVILPKIFTNKVPRKVLIFFSVVSVLSFFSLVNSYMVVLLIIIIIYVAVALYYVVSSWKTLKGAQWSIVAGVVVTLLWVAALIISEFVGQIPYGISFRDFAATCNFLSFPLSLLVYVSIRFKEIIRDVRQNAQQVMQVTEEKRQQALTQQKILEQEVKRQTADLTETLQNLKSTQSLLIQSEKLASLGELTAGIAHEIQNPLNFVNNFSELNAELIKELRTEVINGNLDEVNAITKDIESNSEKINLHGKRAEAIVKGMLQHSRVSSGQKEPTEINKLADEYLRLAYHGLRAKDKSFNATITTDFDESIERVNMIPQDIGRVLLNLYNNAFYAVSEKKKQQPEGYQPTVSVRTKHLDDNLEIRVQDNGNGIPQKVVEKIFQPFFTTKPTGQGTGLGLSLSYDIVKAHGGEIKVETKEGEFTEFVILLPLTLQG